MRRKLAYSNPVLTNSTAKLGSLPQGDWHVSKTGGRLFVGDINWKRYATLGETVNEAEFHLDKTTSMLMQVQDKTTCMDIAIESRPAYDIYVVGGGLPGLLHRKHRTVLAPSRLVVGRENRESMAGPALREQGQHVGSQARKRHHHEGRLALEIRHVKGLVVNPDEKSGLHDAGVQPARLTGLPSSGESDPTAPGGWNARHGHHAGIGAECRRHYGFCGCGDHGARIVRRRSERMADTAGSGSARLRSRHRALLNDGLGVAA